MMNNTITVWIRVRENTLTVTVPNTELWRAGMESLSSTIMKSPHTAQLVTKGPLTSTVQSQPHLCMLILGTASNWGSITIAQVALDILRILNPCRIEILGNGEYDLHFQPSIR